MTSPFGELPAELRKLKGQLQDATKLLNTPGTKSIETATVIRTGGERTRRFETDHHYSELPERDILVFEFEAPDGFRCGVIDDENDMYVECRDCVCDKRGTAVKFRTRIGTKRERRNQWQIIPLEWLTTEQVTYLNGQLQQRKHQSPSKARAS